MKLKIRILIILNEFKNDQIINDDEIIHIFKTDDMIYSKIKELMDNPNEDDDRLDIYTYSFNEELFKRLSEIYDLSIESIDYLYADGTIKPRMESDNIIHILEDNKTYKESAYIDFKHTPRNELYNLRNSCKINSILQKAIKIADMASNNYRSLKPENVYELIKLILSKNPSLGNITMIKDLNDNKLYNDSNNMERIKLEMINTSINNKLEEWKYEFITSYGYFIRCENNNIEINSIINGKEDNVF